MMEWSNEAYHAWRTKYDAANIDMEATTIEKRILQALSGCRYHPGSFDKKFPRQIDVTNISPLQKWWIYKLGFKYRKQIGQDWITKVCEEYLAANEKPLTRKEADKILKQAMKAYQNPELDL